MKTTEGLQSGGFVLFLGSRKGSELHPRRLQGRKHSEASLQLQCGGGSHSEDYSGRSSACSACRTLSASEVLRASWCLAVVAGTMLPCGLQSSWLALEDGHAPGGCRPWRIMPAEKLAEFGTFSGKFHACLVCG